MFKLIEREVYGGAAIYTFDVLDKTYDTIGKMVITIGSGRHDAALVFNRDKIGIVEAYPYINDLRELLYMNLIDCIEEEHDSIILAEIVYENPRYLF